MENNQQGKGLLSEQGREFFFFFWFFFCCFFFFCFVLFFFFSDAQQVHKAGFIERMRKDWSSKRKWRHKDLRGSPTTRSSGYSCCAFQKLRWYVRLSNTPSVCTDWVMKFIANVYCYITQCTGTLCIETTVSLSFLCYERLCSAGSLVGYRF